MFGGRFSLTRFSLNVAVDFDARVEGIFIETIRSVVSSAQNIAIESNYRSHVATEIILTRGIKMNNIFDEKITADVTSVRNAPILMPLKEDINSNINVFVDATVEMVYNEQIQMRPLIAVIDLGFELVLTEEILSNIKSVIDFMVVETYMENVLSDILATTAVSLEYDFNESFDSQVELANNVNAIVTFNEIIDRHIFLVYNYRFTTNFRETFSSINQLSSDTHIVHNLREAIFATTSASELETDTMIINVTIKPGSTLVIDSENFIVTLDGVNVIHLHSGDFINISRDTINMKVTPDGRLSGEIMYVERFL